MHTFSNGIIEKINYLYRCYTCEYFFESDSCPEEIPGYCNQSEETPSEERLVYVCETCIKT